MALTCFKPRNGRNGKGLSQKEKKTSRNMIGLFLGLLQCSCNPIDYILIILEDVRHTVAGEPSKTGVVSLTGRELSRTFSHWSLTWLPYSLAPIAPIINNHHLVGGFNHLEKYESQSGRIIPYIMESHKIHVPNHQPGDIFIHRTGVFYVSIYTSTMDPMGHGPSWWMEVSIFTTA